MLKNLILVLSIILPFLTFSQNAPQTSLPLITSAVPGTVEVPVTVTGFSNIGAIYLSFDYDYSVLQLISATPHPQLPSFLHGDSDLGTGFHRITLGWYGNGLTLPDGSAIMTLSFNYVNGNSALTFFENGPSCEYASGEGNVLNDIPASEYYLDGQVCGLLTGPGPVSGDNNVCQGQSAVAFSVVPLSSATAYTWSVPEGAMILCGQGTNLILVDFSAGATGGNIQVYASSPCGNGPPAVLPVTVNPLPVASAGSDFSIPYGTVTSLHAAPGGSGSFSYHWAPEELLVNPDVQDPVTVFMFSTTRFKLTVTNQYTQCENSDEVVVSISGGPLALNPDVLPSLIPAGGTAQLFAFVSGGSENYTFSWTSDPPGWSSGEQNPQVSPDTSTLYMLSVDDDYNIVTGSVSLQVSSLPTATISGTDTLCGTGSTTTLTVDLTGTPPWDFVYTCGSISEMVGGLYTSPYSLLTGTPGSYTISFVEDAFFRGSGMGTGNLSLFPIPPPPVISMYETTLISNACCGNQWYHNDIPIPGATGISHTATESGKYYDIVTRFSCVSDTSNVINVIIPGIDEQSGPGFVVYPNPAKGKIFVKWNINDSRFTGDLTINIFDVYGRQLMTTRTSGGLEVDISALSPGLYILVLQEGIGMVKFVVGSRQ